MTTLKSRLLTTDFGSMSEGAPFDQHVPLVLDAFRRDEPSSRAGRRSIRNVVVRVPAEETDERRDEIEALRVVVESHESVHTAFLALSPHVQGRGGSLDEAILDLMARLNTRVGSGGAAVDGSFEEVLQRTTDLVHATYPGIKRIVPSVEASDDGDPVRVLEVECEATPEEVVYAHQAFMRRWVFDVAVAHRSRIRVIFTLKPLSGA